MKTEKEQIKILKKKLETLKRWNMPHSIVSCEEPQLVCQFIDNTDNVLKGYSGWLYIRLKSNINELRVARYCLPDKIFEDIYSNTYSLDEVEYWCYRHNEPYRFLKKNKDIPDGQLQPIIKEYRDYCKY